MTRHWTDLVKPLEKIVSEGLLEAALHRADRHAALGARDFVTEC